MKTIYLDHAATTPLSDEVLEAMLPHLRDTHGNPSSVHHAGRRAFDTLEATRTQAARTLGVKSYEIIFTGSGTEANNLALFGIAHAHRARGMHILMSSVEHPSVLGAGEALTAEGFEVEYVPVDTYGRVAVADVLSRVRADTTLISIMYANNEIGTLQPIENLAQALKDTFPSKDRPLLHTDACQATGQLPVEPIRLGVDLMTLNSSKIYGPKGVGLLYVREGVKLAPHIVGGGQESGKRSGTENIAGIVGFTHALTSAVKNTEEHAAKLAKLNRDFTEGIMREIPDAILNGHPTERLPNNVHISLPFIEGESLLLLLDTYGICVSTGSACNAHDLAPSHVLRAIGQSQEIIHGSLRFSFGEGTTEEDLAYTVSILKECSDRLRAISPLPLHL